LKHKPLWFVGAKVYQQDGTAQAREVCIANGRVDNAPHPTALCVDMSGYTLYPGLINSHDHLELNHYPRTKYQERYGNAHQWGEQVNSQLDKPPFKELRAYPLEDKLYIGGLKNLLCGATLVAHHNPPHKPLFRKDFPVRVLQKYGWAHSLHFTPQAEIVTSFKRTPKNTPFFIHLAEGTDETALAEYQTLKELGCISGATRFIHAVGISRADWADAAQFYNAFERTPFIWCPTTNKYLLGETISYTVLGRYGLPALGSDSRLTADGDLLNEMRFAETYWNERLPKQPDIAVQFATRNARLILNVTDSGRLDVSAFADVIAVPEEKRLSDCRRADLALVMREGVPQIGDPDVMAKFPHVKMVDARLDGKEKRINAELATQIGRCSLKEAGLELLERPSNRKLL